MKPFYQSRTLWAAVLTGVIGVLVVVTGEQLVSVEMTGYLVVGIGILQGALRMVTTGSVFLK